MSFSGTGGAGNTITQAASTTDATPAGLGALTGVTTITVGTVTIYNLGGAHLTIAGTLTIDPRAYRIVNAANININGGGTLNAGVQYVCAFGGATLYSTGDAAVFSGIFSSGGTLNLLGATLDATNTAATGFHTWSGTVFVRNGVFRTKPANNNRIRAHTANIDIDGLVTDGVQFDALMIPTSATKLKNIKPQNAGVGIENALNGGNPASQTQTFDGIPDTAGKVSAFASNWSGYYNIQAFASEVGSAVMFMPDNCGSATTSGHGALVFHRFRASVQTLAGLPVQGAVVYLRDTNNGKRKIKNAGSTAINWMSDQVIVQATLASGTIADQTVLTAHIYRDNAVGDISAPDGNEIRDLRGKINVAGSDLFDVHVWSYGHNYAVSLDEQMRGLSTTAVGVKLYTDTAVTRTESAALALTSAATLDDLYDLAKLWKTRAVQAQVEYPSISAQPFSAAGSVLDLGAINLVIDPAAAAAFSINPATHTATVKAVALAAGAKFKSLKTTGAVTAASGASISAPYTDSSGQVVSITGLDPAGFGVTGNLRISIDGGATWQETRTYTGSSITAKVPPGCVMTVQARTRGYAWAQALLNTAAAASLDMGLTADRDLSGVLIQSKPFDAALVGKVAYDYASDYVTFTNTSGGVVQYDFATLYQVIQGITHVAPLCWALTKSVIPNGTRDGLIVETGNPLRARPSADSTAGIHLDCTVTHQATGQPVFDRLRGNAAGYQITLAVSSVNATVEVKAEQLSGVGAAVWDHSALRDAIPGSTLALVKETRAAA